MFRLEICKLGGSSIVELLEVNVYFFLIFNEVSQNLPVVLLLGKRPLDLCLHLFFSFNQ